ncbi:uncharacterized protein YegL [Actinoplanes tereljensis]|uniref:VWFA domain-containing protein n=1 Tax=Paractinoplanes tereljensis TaxID=571912 RepID=A0A919NT76_9ACTN|nr:VWA domain-containing protein [Actinoplanes tereljensis]GIF23112.1 hypothetical protein Ate02nite_58420 [Actinoplanes tereljensis]
MTEHSEDRKPEGEGQIIMPFYLLCDVSLSMTGDMDELNKALGQLHQQLLGEPIINDLVMLSVITFNHEARTVVPLAAPEELNLPALSAGGGTDFSPPLREFHARFSTDRDRLKSEGKRVYRPCIYFLTDGEPNNTSYQATMASLITKEKNAAYPYICAFGFRDASAQTLQTLAYPDFGENNKRGRYFIAKDGASITDVLQAMVGVLARSILQSASSASAGTPLVALPEPNAVSKMGGSFV